MNARTRFRFALWAAAFSSAAVPAVGHGQILQVADMTAEELRTLDRDRTVVLLPGGILEQHGPFLPSFADGYWNERLTRAIAESIVARPGWTVLVFPTIPLGNSGANDIGGRFSYPGTYGVRFTTLRAVFMDLASELGEQGFRRVFVVHAHGAPNHNRALDQAGDYFRDTYGGEMVNVGGLLPVMEAWDGDKTEFERVADGLPIHSGMDETSWMLYLRPHLVRGGHRTAPRLSGPDMEDLVRMAERPDWPGYFGAPDLATAAHGVRIWQRASTIAVDIVGRILDGLDSREIPRFADAMLESEVDRRLDRASLEHEAALRRRQEDWLRRNEREQGAPDRRMSMDRDAADGYGDPFIEAGRIARQEMPDDAVAPAGAARDTLEAVDVYGPRTVPPAVVRNAIGLAAGDPVPASLEPIRARVLAIEGVAAVHASVVCCGETGRPLLYVGIREEGTPPVAVRGVPRGAARLPAEVVELGALFEAAIVDAVRRGATAEDASQGYALSSDSVVRSVQEAFLEVARTNFDTLEAVVRTSSEAAHRALAAQVLAYGADRQAVVRALVHAVRDPSESVRNDAARALALLAGWASENPRAGLSIPSEPFVEFLRSESWTDRNKGVFALDPLTAGRDAALLAELRERALPALVEMARWSHPGHAFGAYIVLARIAGVGDAEAFEAWQAGEREAIVARAAAADR